MANKVPTVIIGIGGIGSKIVAETFKTLSAEDKETIATVCMDTDQRTFEEYKKLGIDELIQTSTNEVVKDYINIEGNEGMRDWLQHNKLLESKSLIEGAGQVRQLSRMATLACINNNTMSGIGRAIDKVNKAGSLFEKSIKVFIVGSIAGGTGAGMMVQLPFYIRHIIKQKTARDYVLVRGLFIDPSITEEKQDNNKTKITSTYANAYACLKEINGFYLKANGVDHDIPIDVDYYREGMLPYDFLFLIGRQNCKGGILGNGKAENYFEMTKEILRTQLTPIAVDAYSAEDNLILSLLQGQGMNRYCSAGAIGITYPFEKIADYCAYRWSEETIKAQWVKIDEDFKRKQGDDRRKQATDPGYIPDTEDTYYVSRFEELSSPDSYDILFKNLRIDLDSVSGTADEDSGMLSLTDAIRRFSEEKAVSDEVNNRRNACAIDTESIVDPLEGEEDTVVVSALKRLEEYLHAIKINQQNVFSTIDAIMPSAPQINGVSSERYAERDYNVFNALRQVHPIVARYILHRLKKELGELLEAEGSILSKQQSKLNMMREVDFDEEAEGINSPNEVYIRLLSEKEDGVIRKLRERFSKNQSKLEDFAELFRSKINEQREVYRQYNLSYYNVKVYEEVIRRVEELLDVYKVFFDALPGVARDIDYEVEKLEKMHDLENVTTRRFVFADKECKRLAYDILQKKSSMNDSELPKEVKARFADDIYDIFVDYYNSTRGVSEDVKEGYRKNVSRKAKNLYNDSIFKGMKAQTRRYMDTYLDIGVIKALEYELLYEKILADADENREMAVNEFLVTMGDYEEASIKTEFDTEMKKVISRATPFMLIHGDPKDEAIYWGMNPSLFDRKDNGEPDIGRMADRIPTSGLTSTVVADNDFSRNSVVCYRIMYAAFVEDIAYYDNNSTAYRYYCDRIDTFLAHVDESSYGGDFENGVTPHIDRRWHNEAYLPHLIPQEREKERNDSYLAFVSMLMFDGIVDLDEYNGKKRWEYTKALIPYDIRIDDKLTAPTYISLMRSVKYNPLIKRDILDMVRGFIDEDEYNTSDIETDIFEHRMIKGFGELRDITGEVTNGSGTMTVLDLFASLKKPVGTTEFKDMIMFFREYTRDYCGRMSDGSEQCNKLYVDIMKKLLEASREETRAVDAIGNLIRYEN